MQRLEIVLENHEHWLRERSLDITSTDIGALFNISPYNTSFELWNLKNGVIENDFKETDRIKWGRKLEDAIAEMAAEELGLDVSPFKTYMRIPGEGIGSSFDYAIMKNGSRDGILEC